MTHYPDPPRPSGLKRRRRGPYLSLMSMLPLLGAEEAHAQDGCYDDIPGLPSLLGTSIDDYIFLSNNAEGFCALGGDDTVFGAGGDDFISGGQGNDSLIGAYGADYLEGGDGNDRLFGASPYSHSDGDDSLFGGRGADVLFGDGGNDYLSGGDQEDTLCGGAGHDVLMGGDHADMLMGDSGHGVLYGEEGDDTLSGGQSTDLLFGGPGDDVLFGAYGNDQISGGPGVDRLMGNNGDDTFNYSMGDGSDTLFDPLGSNTLRLHAIPSSMVSSVPLPSGDLAIVIAQSGVILVEKGSNPLSIEYCQKWIPAGPGSSLDLELCGEDLEQPQSSAKLKMGLLPGGSTAFLVIGSSLSPVSIPGTGSSLLPGGALLLTTVPVGPSGTVEFQTSPQVSGVGVTVYAQVVADTSEGIQVSNGLEIKL